MSKSTNQNAEYNESYREKYGKGAVFNKELNAALIKSQRKNDEVTYKFKRHIKKLDIAHKKADEANKRNELIEEAFANAKAESDRGGHGFFDKSGSFSLYLSMTDYKLYPYTDVNNLSEKFNRENKSEETIKREKEEEEAEIARKEEEEAEIAREEEEEAEIAREEEEGELIASQLAGDDNDDDFASIFGNK